MWLQFFAQNAHFAICLFAALVSMGICWLYLDAWTSRHDAKELFKWVGFGLLGISFLLQATRIEQTVLGQSVFGNWTISAAYITQALAFISIIIGQLIDPLQAVPKNPGLQQDEPQEKSSIKLPESIEKLLKPEDKKSHAVMPLLTLGGKIAIPLGGLSIAALYWRRATTGLERHYKPVARAFLFFAISDAIGLASVLRDTTNPLIYGWVAAFGWIWWLQQLTLLAGVIY